MRPAAAAAAHRLVIYDFAACYLAIRAAAAEREISSSGALSHDTQREYEQRKSLINDVQQEQQQ